jgi:lipid-binding SYLF domain-containing protein
MKVNLSEIISCTLIACSIALAGCTTAPDTITGRAELVSKAAEAMNNARANDRTLVKPIDDAYGYAVFPSIGKGGAGFGGAYGQGVVYENGLFVGYCDVSQVTVGFQLGGQTYTEIILFATKNALDAFKTGNFTFDAQATAVAIRSGAGTNAKYDSGVAIFTMDEKGLMYEASVGGQKFSYQTR